MSHEDDDITIPVEFWHALTEAEFNHVLVSGFLDAGLCKRLWKIARLKGPVPESLKIHLHTKDGMEIYPTIRRAPAMAALTQSDLDAIGCDTPNYDHDHGMLSLVQRCHPKAGADVKYIKATGTLEIRCRRCGKPMAAILVAERFGDRLATH